MKKQTYLLIALLFTFVLSPVVVLGKTDNAVAQTVSKAKQAVVGQVESITTNQINLKNKQTAKIDATTKVVSQDKKTLKLSNIKPNDKVAVISTDSGKVATDGSKIKKITKVYVKQATSSAQMNRQAVHGVITNLSGSVITLAHQTQKDRVYTVNTTASTTVKMKDVDPATVANLQTGQRVVVIGDPMLNNTFTAIRIHVIPGKATGVFNKQPVSTTSAKLTVTPTKSATVSATPTLTLTPTLTSTPTATLTPTSSPTPTTTP